jgi:hypothetical protein
MKNDDWRLSMSVSKITSAALGAAILAMGSAASAQWDPEGGDNWQQQQPPPDQTQQQQQQPPPDQTQQQQQQQGWGQQQTNQQQGWQEGQQQQEEQPPAWGEGQEQPPSGEEEEETGESDHARVVGHLGVGYLGAIAVPVGIATAIPGVGVGTPGAAERTITAPVIGIRFWLSELIGLDIGIGFGYTSTVATSGAAGTSMTLTDENGFAFGLHAGLPLAIYHNKHYKLIIVPEANIAYGTYTILGPSADSDQSLTGLLFTLGARIGTEIHFGFIGIPELSLQASVGLEVRINTRSWETYTPGAFPYQDGTSISIGTTVQNEPWNIFIGNVAALYYF